MVCTMQVPTELFPKENTCDCRGGNARLGSRNGIAPSTVVTDTIARPYTHTYTHARSRAYCRICTHTRTRANTHVPMHTCKHTADLVLPPNTVCGGDHTFALRRCPHGLHSASQVDLARGLCGDPINDHAWRHHVARARLV